MVIGVVHHRLGHQRRRPHALEAGHRAGALLRAVHARGVELDDTVGVGEGAVADAGLERIELGNVDAGDERVENVLAFGDQPERPLTAFSGPPFVNSMPEWSATTTGRTVVLTAGAWPCTGSASADSGVAAAIEAVLTKSRRAQHTDLTEGRNRRFSVAPLAGSAACSVPAGGRYCSRLWPIPCDRPGRGRDARLRPS